LLFPVQAPPSATDLAAATAVALDALAAATGEVDVFGIASFVREALAEKLDAQQAFDGVASAMRRVGDDNFHPPLDATFLQTAVFVGEALLLRAEVGEMAEGTDCFLFWLADQLNRYF